MLRVLYSLLLIALFALSALATTTPPYLSNAATIDVQPVGTGEYRITFHSILPKRQETTWAGKPASEWQLDGEGILGIAGAPNLPAIHRAVRIGDHGSYSLRIKRVEYEDIPGITIAPFQDRRETSDTTLLSKIPSFDEKIYSSNEWFPAQPVMLSEPAIARDARVSALQCAPIQYNPITKTARVYSSIEVEIVRENGAGINELNRHVGAVPSFSGIYRSMIGAEDLAEACDQAVPGTILVFCRDDTNVMSRVREYTHWKTQSGRPCQVVTFPTVSALTSSQLSTAIAFAYSTSQPPLEFVVIVGDDGTTGAYNIPAAFSGYGCTDHDYTCIAGNDILGDVTLGRFSCSSLTELWLMLKRSIDYEKDPPRADTTWFSQGWSYVGISNNVFSSIPMGRFCNEMMHLQGIARTYFDTFNGAIDPSFVSSRFQHGFSHWMCRVPYPGEFTGIPTMPIYPVFASIIGASCGDWEGSTTGMHEQFIRMGTVTQPRGAIACVSIGTSAVYTYTLNVFSSGMYYGFGTYQLRQPGPIVWYGKYELWRELGLLEIEHVTSHTRFANLMGDPTALLWSGVPQLLTVDFPDTIGVGQNSLAVTVHRGDEFVRDAVVTAWKPIDSTSTETYSVARTDSNGVAILPLTNTTPGTLYLTVINDRPGQNALPYSDSITVETQPVDLLYSSLTIRDDNTLGTIGNGDHTANPNETIGLRISIQNVGTQSATNVSGRLVCTDARFGIAPIILSWPTITSGSSVSNTQDYLITIPPSVHDLTSIPLQLTLYRSNPTDSSIFSIPVTVRSLDLRLKRLSVQNLSGAATQLTGGAPGYLEVVVENGGGISVGAIRYTCQTNSAYVTVVPSQVLFTSLAIGDSSVFTGTNRFQITIDSLAPLGIPYPVLLIGTSGSFIDTLEIAIPTAPRPFNQLTGPDRYGYCAYDESDTIYQIGPIYQWNEIALPANLLPLTDPTETTDASIALPLPFRVTYYGQQYDSITVCSNGWIAFGVARRHDVNNESVPTCVLYNNFRNWHLPAPEGPPNMVAVLWDDLIISAGDGVYAQFNEVNHTYTITWKTHTRYANSVEEFQIVIYDLENQPIICNDTPLLFQYKTFHNDPYALNDTPSSTIGIANSTYTDGLEYFFYNQYTPGSDTIPNGTNINHAILFVPTAPGRSGVVTGQVRRADTNDPIPNALIRTGTFQYSFTTNETGQYSFHFPVGGDYRITASATGYNPLAQIVTVFPDCTITQDFSLTNPNLRIEPDSLNIRVPSNRSVTREWKIVNTGNGPLQWMGEITSVGQTNHYLDSVFAFDVSAQTNGDLSIRGVEFDSREFFVVGSNGTNNPNKLYRFNRNGILISTVDQPTTSTFGWRDLAYDGEYFYACENNVIQKFDRNATVVREYPIALNPATGIAIDTVNDILYYTGYAQPIYGIRLSNGNLVSTIQNSNWISGLAWYPNDPDNEYLYYTFRSDASQYPILGKMNPMTGSSHLIDSLRTSSNFAEGCAITSRWNPLLWTLITVKDGGAGHDQILLNQLHFNTGIWNTDPLNGSIAAGDSTILHFSFNPAGLTPDTMSVLFHLTTDPILPTRWLPIHIQVEPPVSAPEAVASIPYRFTLDQNYPNPFNATTSISFELPTASFTKMAIFDITGREIQQLVSSHLQPGRYSIRFDGSRMGSGVFFCRLQSGDRVAVRKMAMIK